MWILELIETGGVSHAIHEGRGCNGLGLNWVDQYLYPFDDKKNYIST